MLDRLTTILGDRLRAFKADTCPAFETKELRKEANARQRRQAVQVAKNSSETAIPASGSKTTPHAQSNPTLDTMLHVNQTTSIIKPATNSPATRKAREFNMNTYKTHALGDYVETIRQYGTTDSYSTELVSGF